jgi:cytochrome P450
MRELRPHVEALTSGLLDDLARRDPPVDLNEALAVPLPILVICELLGVPYEDRTRLRQWTRAAADVTDRARSEQGLADLFSYGQQLVARKRAQPGDDVVSRLCATESVSDDEAAMLAMHFCSPATRPPSCRSGWERCCCSPTPISGRHCAVIRH